MDTDSPSLNRRILLIDDNEAIHSDFRKIFRAVSDQTRNSTIDESESVLFEDAPRLVAKHSPFHLDFATQGVDGLALVRQAEEQHLPYAMAFIDVRMPPGWDGVETARRIWQIDPEMQIVICTAYSDYGWEEMQEQLGFSDRLVVLKKPFDSIEVLQLAGALTSKWSLAQQAKYRRDDLERMVTERTEQLFATKQMYRALLENTSAMPWELDPQDRSCLYIGPQVERLLGWTPNHFARPGFIIECSHPDDRAHFAKALSEQGFGADTAVEHRLRHRDGHYIYFRSNVARNGADERWESVRGISIDVTHQKALELELHQAQKLESVGRLAAGVAHEINTPIQFVNDSFHFMRDGMAELQTLVGHYRGALQDVAEGRSTSQAALQQIRAREQAADVDYLLENMPGAIDRSLEGLQRVTTIVRSMKEFAHPDQKEKAYADLNQAILSTLTVARSEYKYVADVCTELGEIPPVSCFLGDLNQALLNIVINAAHAIEEAVRGSDKRGCITIRTVRDGGDVVISVQDTGGGIPAAIRDKIFDPFFTTKDVGRGTGQGLAIARSVVVDKHQGELRFDSEPGVGTTFYLRLPIEPAKAGIERAAA
ncbi:MAG: Blue-light-activated protein [Hydrocarboniphaga sp.]|uniref:ATP-binding protein n=1 Tax=Hydrocarboniphaga sp. TaxID=2033016 RepID=UPI00261F4636|nr:ATP-binding protein [Hydrocarboniphaga sp.]MDB5970588.1 Blue-light-activated protein [Hydrocarboniphaga sp.]